MAEVITIRATSIYFGAVQKNSQLVERLMEGHVFKSEFKQVPDSVMSENLVLTRRDGKKMDRFSLLGIAAAQSCFEDGRLDEKEIYGCEIFLGNMTGGWTYTEPQLRKLHSEGLLGISPYLASAWFPAAPQGQISIHLKVAGLAKTVTTDRCGGAQAIGMGLDRVRSNYQLVLCGAVEAPVTPFVEAAYRKAYSNSAHLCEGAAMIVLEKASLKSAINDNRPVLCNEISRPILATSDSCKYELAEMLKTILTVQDKDNITLVILSMNDDVSIKTDVVQLIHQTLNSKVLNIIDLETVLGDALAVNSAAAVIAAAEFIKSKKHLRVLVISVGHQCLSAITLNHPEVLLG